MELAESLDEKCSCLFPSNVKIFSVTEGIFVQSYRKWSTVYHCTVGILLQITLDQIKSNSSSTPSS